MHRTWRAYDYETFGQKTVIVLTSREIRSENFDYPVMNVCKIRVEYSIAAIERFYFQWERPKDDGDLRWFYDRALQYDNDYIVFEIDSSTRRLIIRSRNFEIMVYLSYSSEPLFKYATFWIVNTYKLAGRSALPVGIFFFLCTTLDYESFLPSFFLHNRIVITRSQNHRKRKPTDLPRRRSARRNRWRIPRARVRIGNSTLPTLTRDSCRQNTLECTKIVAPSF